MTIIAAPCDTAVQLSGLTEKLEPMLSVVCKRTYRVLPDGRCVQASEPVPLVPEPEPDPDNPRRLHRDTDLYPFKPMTDVVVRGHAYGERRRSSVVAVQVGSARKQIAVFGDRRCTLDQTGRIVFSLPDPIDRIPLRYDRAYGGLDQVAHETHGNPVEALKKYLDPSIDISLSTPYIYPRNFVGCGYLIEPTRAAVERLSLPNLEDPEDLLSPTRLAVGNPARWPLMPIPHSTDWVDHGTFPRLCYAGIVHDHEDLSTAVLEVQRGWAPPDVVVEAPFQEKASTRFANGASLGLQVPYLRGDEECLLAGVQPNVRLWKFRLPNERPEIQVDGRKGSMKPTQPVIHSVEIEPDARRVTIVWRGSASALRPYSEDELKTMPMLVRWP